MATSSNFDPYQYQNLQKKLNESNTAYGYGSKPTEQDIANQREMLRLKSQKDAADAKMLQERWYGSPSDNQDEGSDANRKSKEGLLTRGINALASPLYAIVGGAEALTGKGTVPGFSNIAKNVSEKETFGDLLRKFDVPNVIAMPLGLAMDIGADPVNWITAGTTAFVPRSAIGLKEGGIEGLRTAVSSGALSKAETISKYIPFLRKSAAAEKLSSASFGAREAFNNATGRTVENVLDRPRLLEGSADNIRGALGKTPAGKKLLKFFDYSSQRDIELRKMLDSEDVSQIVSGNRFQSPISLASAAGDNVNISELQQSASRAMGREVSLDEAMQFGEQNLPKASPKSLLQEAVDTLGPEARPLDIVRYAKQKVEQSGADIAVGLKQLTSLDHPSVASGLNAEGQLDSMWKKLNEFELQMLQEDGKIGIDTLDNINSWFKDMKVGNVEVGQKIVDGYSKFIGLFKNAKVPLSPAAYINATMGNTTMGYMAGLHMFRPEYMKNIMATHKLLSGTRDPNFLYKMVKDPALQEVIQKFPGTFESIFGIHPNLFRDAETYVNDIITKGTELKKLRKDVPDSELQDVKSIISEWMNSSYKTANKDVGFPKVNTTESFIDRPEGTLRSTLFGGELYESGYSKMVKKFEQLAKEGNGFAKAAHWYFTRPMDAYGRIDQSFKFGVFKTLIQDGVNERELNMLSRLIKINPAEVTQIKGKNLWKIDPEKAMDFAQEIFMNYAAMPGAVRLLRSLPLFGSPFASFMYGMGTKTGKTLLNNPSVFNKISFALKELQGGRSPLEKQQLEGQYYQWFNRAGMMKLPFFQKNPVYMNVANLLPYYTLNIFQPGERTYENEKTFGSKIMSAIDQSPFLKTPEGQIMTDYFILPIILRESNPHGMFDQPLWPTDATALQKVGYAARAAAETPVPGALAPLGLITPEKYAEFIPSFRWRQLSYAKAGKTSAGVPGKENPVERTARTIMSMFGLPMYKMDLTYSSKKDNSNK